MIDEHRVFYPSMCFVCYLTLRDVELMRCSSCKLVSYCSKSHQRKDWKSHKEFCIVARYTAMNLSQMNIDDSKDWFKFRINYTILCEMKLGRQLMQHEMTMVLFQTSCHVCHKRTNLKTCLNCLSVSYCSDDHKNKDYENHRSLCNTFSFSREIEFYSQKAEFHHVSDIRKGEVVLTDDMKEFIETNVIWERNVINEEVEKALLSEALSCPLTLMYVLNKIGYTLPQKAVLHLVGSSILETSILFSWNIILHIQKHVKEIVIYFIGPDAIKLKDLAIFHEGKLKFKFSDKLYHDFVKSEIYEKPDVICAFNCGFHEFDSTTHNTWKESLPFLIENNRLPFFFTSFTKDEGDQDLNQLQMVKPDLDADMELNPFSGLRPVRDPENLGVFFCNRYLTIVKHSV